MARKSRMIRVSGEFEAYLSGLQRQLNTSTGKKWSQVEITAFIATSRPIIRIMKRKKRKQNFFDSF